MRDEEVKQDFIQYMADHPDERFWQSVCNWSGYSAVGSTNEVNVDGDYTNYQDLFYKEGK